MAGAFSGEIAERAGERRRLSEGTDELVGGVGRGMREQTVCGGQYCWGCRCLLHAIGKRALVYMCVCRR